MLFGFRNKDLLLQEHYTREKIDRSSPTVGVTSPLHSLTQAGGSLEPAFGLRGAVRSLNEVLPALDRVLVLSTPTRSRALWRSLV